MNSPDRDIHATRPSIFLRLREGDESAVELSWREFHERYAPLVAGVSRHLGLPGADIDDVVQDVMLGFFSAAPQFEYDPARGRFRGDLKAATARAVAKARRRTRRESPGEAVDDEAPDEALDQAWCVEWDRSVLVRALRAAAERVEPRTFEAFELTSVRDVPTPAAAEQLAMSEDSVRQARRRVARLVREEIDRISAEE